MKTHLLLLAALAAALFITGCRPSPPEKSGQKYHCPMHPTYISDRPGDCPICNMKLEPVQADDSAATHRHSGKPYLPRAGQYYCPMKCDGSISDQPGDCPVCGMKLLQADEAKAAQFAAAAAAPEPPPGRTMIAVSPERRQAIGLQTATVERRLLRRDVWATAVVEHDETRYTRIAPRFAGWVKEVYVNFTGQEVAAGQPLFRVYSPDLLAAENEYLMTLRHWRQLSTNRPGSLEVEAAQRLAQSARKRLELWQIAAEEIAAIEQEGRVNDETLIRAPFTGHVVAKTAVEGRAFMAGETLYEMADLHHLWLRASVWEGDWPLMRTGLTARIRFPAWPDHVFTNAVAFLYPHVDPLTRRGELRIELDNPQHHLRPGMWAEVHLEISLGLRLVAPAAAVLDTGQRQLVFLEREDGHLEPREVTVGFRTDDFWEVLSGLQEGDRVVTRALFLIDSESQLKAAISAMTTPASRKPSATNNAAPVHQH